MTIDELKHAMDEQRARMKSRAGKACRMSDSGPVDAGIIEALIATIEAQDKRIAALENK